MQPMEPSLRTSPRQRLNEGAGTRLLLLSLFGFFAVYRLLLARSGQLYWPDEFRYLHSLHLLDDLRKGHFVTGMDWMFGFANGGRPGFVLLSTVPAALQGIANLVWGVEPSSPIFYRIPSTFNVLVSLGVAAAFYRLLVIATSDRSYALIGTLVYGLLVNTNLYVRHLFPFDLALLLLLCSLVLVVSERQSAERLRTRAIAAGVLSGLAFTTYPGYDPFVVLLAAALFMNPVGAWRHLVTLGGSILLVVLVWELIARAAGMSFIVTSFRFSSTVTQGSFEEGYRFLPVYLLDVEGLAGGVLLVLAASFAVTALARRDRSVEAGVVGAAVAAYFAYATAGVVFRKMVYYGRLLHMYMPFLVLAAILAVQAIRNQRVRRLIATALVLASVVAFVPTAPQTLTAHFPNDVDREVTAASAGATVCRVKPEGDDRFGTIPPECDLVLENARHLFPLPRGSETSPPAGFTLVKSWPHPLQFRGYWYEGATIAERAGLRTYPPEIRLYRRSGSDIPAALRH